MRGTLAGFGLAFVTAFGFEAALGATFEVALGAALEVAIGGDLVEGFGAAFAEAPDDAAVARGAATTTRAPVEGTSIAKNMQ
ncbi:MAG TPA: hypothetical protein VJT73_15885 [Polyangiaceae bacterium]|nr:hypothetical protein [Polyangiaceae bacterium]